MAHCGSSSLLLIASSFSRSWASAILFFLRAEGAILKFGNFLIKKNPKTSLGMNKRLAREMLQDRLWLFKPCARSPEATSSLTLNPSVQAPPRSLANTTDYPTCPQLRLHLKQIPTRDFLDWKPRWDWYVSFMQHSRQSWHRDPSRDEGSPDFQRREAFIWSI